MKISSATFRRVYERFQNIHMEKNERVLTSFLPAGSLAFEWEDYKRHIPDTARKILNVRKWSKASIGKGGILKQVIQAIEIDGNNLLQWKPQNGPQSRVHLCLLQIKKGSEKCKELETLFFDLYKRKRGNQVLFESLVSLCGKHYELLGYLFFIADSDRFLPIRTKSFDKALNELGLNIRTERQCGWENYQRFLGAMREVQRCLHAEGIMDASLLDAHSFCWIIARHPAPSSIGRKSQQEAELIPFSDSLNPATETFSLTDDAEIRDMRNEADKCYASGQIAEEVALAAERVRLRKEGRPDLANKVELVSERPGLGYDIKSFNFDGSDRFVEVKNVSSSNRFFLSRAEWLNSRERTNYWLYLVSGISTDQLQVKCMTGKMLEHMHLQPVQYLVKFSPGCK